MTGKRRRESARGALLISVEDEEGAKNKPMSAIAAARFRAQPVPTADSSVSFAAESKLLRYGNEPFQAVEAVVPAYEEAASEEEDYNIPQNEPMGNWRYGGENVIDDTEKLLIVSLRRGEGLTFVGVFDFTVLKGAININGANLAANQPQRQGPQVRRAFVPSTHPISFIKALDDDNQVRFVHCVDTPSSFAGISPLFAKIWNDRPSGLPCKSFTLITESRTNVLQRALNPESVQQDWTHQIEDCASKSSVTMIFGEPSSGKSNFARRLLNRLLTGYGKTALALPSVFFLDLDMDSPEYSPHGQLSLVLVREVNLGPSYIHPATLPCSSGRNETIRSHPFPVGDISNDYHQFLLCVENLLQTYTNLHQKRPSIPLVINTPGWMYTTGFDVLLRIIAQITPQRLIYIRDRRLFDRDVSFKLSNLCSAAAENKISLHEISAKSTTVRPSRTQSELRSMQMLTYFHCTGQGTELDTAQRLWNFRPLSHMTPWEFCYEETDNSSQTFIGFLSLRESVEPQHLFTALNGAIIQIVETEDENVQDLFGRLPRTNKYRIPYFEKGPNDTVEPLDPHTSRLVCTVLLRSWDPENRIAQVLVPKTHEVLLDRLKPEKTIFVFGCCESPEWAYMEDAYYDAAGRGTDGMVRNQLAPKNGELPPWVAKAEEVENMGSLNTTRRIRKFQQ